MASLNRTSTTAKVLASVVLLVLLSNAMLAANGQNLPIVCLINCGVKLITCAVGCGQKAQNPLCFVGCGAAEVSCVLSCNGISAEIPPVVPTIKVTGRQQAGIETGTMKAVVIISSSSSSGEKSIKGSLQFLQDSTGVRTHIKGRIAGLTPGLHGLHIYWNSSCNSIGPHFNPLNKEHGALSDQNLQLGYLGYIIADPDGIAELSIEDKNIPLINGRHSIPGRAVVVHADPDDLGRGGDDRSKTTGGNAGANARFGCGIIELKSSM